MVGAVLYYETLQELWHELRFDYGILHIKLDCYFKLSISSKRKRCFMNDWTVALVK